MAKELYAKVRNNVVPFEQNGEFFYKKARKYAQNNNYIDALNFYRKAVEKDPENLDYMLELAQIFTEMSFFEESNKILFSILENDKIKSDCYFGMGCNFLGLQEYGKAEECFDKYLQIEPEYGLYSEDANELLDILRNEEYMFETFDDINLVDEKVYRMASRGKRLLDQGQYDKAARQLKKVVKLDPSLVFARNNLALAYFCMKKLDKAIEITLDILNEYPLNVHANCNMAIFLNEKGSKADSNKYMQVVLDNHTDDIEELHKIAITFCELKNHKEANKYLKILAQYKPYDIKILHYLAVSCLNLKRYREAINYWSDIDKISPNNTISFFYKKYTQELMNNDSGFREIPYIFQVPYDEVILRVKKINELLKLSKNDLKQKWENEDFLSNLFMWGLGLDDVVVKKAILSAVASFDDQKAERFLREFILRRNENGEIKKEALTLLKQIGAKEPYIAYIDDSIVEVRVNVVDISSVNIPDELEAISDLVIENMNHRYTDGYQEEIKNLWSRFVKALYPDHMPKIRKKEAWAAAVELYYCMKNHINVNKSVIIQSYGITYSSLERNYKKLINVLGIE